MKIKLLKTAVFTFLLLGFFILPIQAQNASDVARNTMILADIARHKPLNGYQIPANIKSRLGATHVGGRYELTKEPFLLEGCKKLNELGFGVCKLWFYPNSAASGYRFNSAWNIPSNCSLAQLAQQPYYRKAFDLPFSTIILSTSSINNKDAYQVTEADLKREENQFYDLATYLLTTYKNRRVTFILENWEGDWIVRGSTNWDAQWGRVSPPADVKNRFLKMRAWFTARQHGIARARKDITHSLCKVYHAIEVNKVIDCMHRVPGLTNDVLPFVQTDLVSWSAYDATDFDKTGLDLYKGIDYIRRHMKPTAEMKGQKQVFLGEIGVPEIVTKETPQEFIDRWDTYLGVCLAQKVPYMVQWELYCNEVNNPKLTERDTVKAVNDMRGFWLIRPDGTRSYAMQYFDQVLKHANSKIRSVNPPPMLR